MRPSSSMNGPIHPSVRLSVRICWSLCCYHYNWFALFLLHINDLPSVIQSQVRLFADDCLLYHPIRSSLDQEILQQDLTALKRWGDTWGMKFNASKCNIMTISRSRSPFIHFHSLCGQILVSVSEAKYLGIFLSNELSWSPHVQSLYNKSSSILSFLWRNLRRCPAKLKESAYIALVRSCLEYGAPVWDPHLVKDSKLLEDLQRRAARFVKGDFQSRSSVTSMLWDLGWQDLKHRRRDLTKTGAALQNRDWTCGNDPSGYWAYQGRWTHTGETPL